jgi:N6-adenosine-specific RNA methylase IME4
VAEKELRVRQVDPKLLKPHPLAHLIPDMRASEWQDFYTDIGLRGIKVPLEVLGDGTVVDGRHRLKAALELAMKKVPVVDAPLNGDNPEVYMMKAAVLRRHLTDDQRACIAALWIEENKKEPELGERNEMGQFLPSALHGAEGKDIGHPTRAKASKDFKVSRKKIDKAKKLKKEAPDLFEKVHKGDITLTNAYRTVENEEAAAKKVSRPMPTGQYSIILADPPWQSDFSPTSARRTQRHYPVKPLDELKQMKIPSAENAMLFLWSTAPMLKQALELMEAWGFEYRTNAVWDKEAFGTGYYFRNQHELLLVGKKGKFPTPAESNRSSSVIKERRHAHSQKPETAYEIIEKMYPGESRLELFARNERKGWASWGNEPSAV